MDIIRKQIGKWKIHHRYPSMVYLLKPLMALPGSSHSTSFFWSSHVVTKVGGDPPETDQWSAGHWASTDSFDMTRGSQGQSIHVSVCALVALFVCEVRWRTWNGGSRSSCKVNSYVKRLCVTYDGHQVACEPNSQETIRTSSSKTGLEPSSVQPALCCKCCVPAGAMFDQWSPASTIVNQY